MSEFFYAFAFVLGLASFFTPCAAGMVPAYLGFYLRIEEAAKKTVPTPRRLARAAGFGLVTTGGFVSIFGIAGAAFIGAGSSLGQAIGPNLYLITLVVGVVLIVAGIASLLNKTIPFSFPVTAPGRRSIVGFYLFGVVYALVSFSCNLPLFIVLLTLAIRAGGGVAAAVIVLCYALGKGTMMTLASLLVALPQASFDVRRLVRATQAVKRVSGAILVVSGVVLIGYYAYLIWKINAALPQ